MDELKTPSTNVKESGRQQNDSVHHPASSLEKPEHEIETARNSLHSEVETIAEESSAQDVEAVASSPSQSEPVYSVFSPGMKRFIVALATLSSLFSPISSFIYLPAIDVLASYYGRSIAAINLTITTYQILQGLSPMFYGNMADTIGRRPVYILTFTVYLGANLGLALQNSYAALMVLRAMQSAGSSATIALGNAVVSDVATASERAGWIGYVYAGVMIGPAFAPTIGGLVTEFLDWRWIFWLLLILNGAYLVVYILINPETARNVVDDGSITPPKLNQTAVQLIRDAIRRSKGVPDPMQSEAKRLKAAELAVKRGKFRFPNPIASLRCILEPDVAVVMAYQALMVAAFYTIMVPITPVFSDVYGFNELQIGLCYIPFAVGAAAGSIGFGKFLNYNFTRTAKRLGIQVDRKKASKMRDFPIEKARLEYIFGPNLVAAAGLLCWGWTLEQRPNLAGPLVILAFTAVGSTGSSTMVNTLLVDLYPESPATVSAANNVVRCLTSAAASAVIQYIIDALGLGWCYTLLAGIVAAASGLLVISMKYGPGWREKRAVRMEKKAAEQKEEEELKEAAAREEEKAQIESEKAIPVAEDARRSS